MIKFFPQRFTKYDTKSHTNLQKLNFTANSTNGIVAPQKLTQDTVQLSIYRNPIEELYKFKQKYGQFMNDYRCAIMAKEEFRMFSERPKNPINNFSIRKYLLDFMKKYNNPDDYSISRMEEILKKYNSCKTQEEKESLFLEFKILCDETLDRKQEFLKLKDKLGELYIESRRFVDSTKKGDLKPARNIENLFELVRDPRETRKKPPKEYVENSKDVREFLNNAIDSGKYTDNHINYIRTMNEAHRLAYSGKSGNNLYYKKYGRLYPIEPGKWRKDDLQHGREPNTDSFGVSIKDIAKKYNDPIQRIIDMGKKSKSFRIDLKNIPQEYQPMDIWQYTNYDGCIWLDFYKHMYPSKKSLVKYHLEMYRTANEAIKRIKNGESEKRILEILAEHYQYAVNARPYEQINNSLYMNEINTLLQMAGMRVMPHGALDLVAQRLQPESFKKYFIDTYYETSLPDFNIDREVLEVKEL